MGDVGCRSGGIVKGIVGNFEEDCTTTVKLVIFRIAATDESKCVFCVVSVSRVHWSMFVRCE